MNNKPIFKPLVFLFAMFALINSVEKFTKSVGTLKKVISCSVHK